MDEISYTGSSASPKRKIPKRLALFGLLIVIVLILLGSVAFFATRGEGESEDTTSVSLPEQNFEEEVPTPEEEETTPTPSAASTKTPTPSKASSENSSELRVAVQNGSGESGVAAKASQILKDAGYNVVSTGNADNFDYEGVTIKIKTSKKSELSDLEAALSDDYTIGDTSTDLSEGQSYDALVIIGS